ncbi:MAG: glycoside hydrolase family 140 protein [Thermoguttaceae bacterium]|nr:glycoside hydrolase family 140 protein [Thermoguttaceae bacterium]
MKLVQLFIAAFSTLLLCPVLSSGDEALPRLKVSENRRFLVTEDGAPFFWLGDTAWELFHRLDKEGTLVYLDNRQKLGFNVVQAVVVAELDGKTRPSAEGFLPFGPDPKEPKPVEVEGDYNDYWDRVDFVVREANRRGIYVAMLPTWGRYWRDESFFNSSNAGDYGEWLGKRYKDAGVIWILGGDRHIDNDEQRKTLEEMAAGLRRGDGGAHLISFHPTGRLGSAQYWHESDWLDFNMRQNGHVLDYSSYSQTYEDYCREPAKPVIDGEPVYEHIPINFQPEEQGYATAFDVRKALYWDLFNGAFGHTYGCNDVWQMVDEDDPNKYAAIPTPRSWREALDNPGAAQMQYAKKLIESRPFLTRVPDPELIVPDKLPAYVPGTGTRRFVATRDVDGTYAMVYFPIGRAATIELGRLNAETLRAYWFDPRVGSAKLIGEFKNEGRKTFEPPLPGEDVDWVLVIDDASKNYPTPDFKTIQ